MKEQIYETLFCVKEMKSIVYLSLRFAARALFCDNETSILPRVHQQKILPKTFLPQNFFLKFCYSFISFYLLTKERMALNPGC